MIPIISIAAPVFWLILIGCALLGFGVGFLIASWADSWEVRAARDEAARLVDEALAKLDEDPADWWKRA